MAKREDVLAPLFTALRDLVAWFDGTRVSGLIIGGVAASLLGRPRLTRDVDALVLLEEREWETFLSRGAGYGFIPRISDSLPFARKARIFLVHHKSSAIDVDIAVGDLPFEREAISRGLRLDIGGLKLPLPRAEDLIVMKAVAHRPRDLVDIEAVLDAHPRLDLRRIRRWVREFSAALDMPDILKDLENILRRRRGRKK